MLVVAGITQEVVDVADKIIIEVNTSMPSFRKMHDMCKDLRPPARQPLLINRVDDRLVRKATCSYLNVL